MLKPVTLQPGPRLPFRFWGQYAHLTVPANRTELLAKAIREGTGPTGRLLASAGTTPAELADALGLPEVAVHSLLEVPRPAPLVVIDAEDGLPIGFTADRLVDGIVGPLSVERSAERPGPLVFYRMPGLAVGGLDQLRAVLGRLAEKGALARLDGVVIPKVEAGAEVQAVAELVTGVDHDRASSPARLRVMVQIESAAGLATLPTIARFDEAPVAALIFGAVDYAADLGLPSTDLGQPAVQHARLQIVEASAIARVPAIDGMTLAYPVLDPALDHDENRSRWLDRMALAYSDAKAAFGAGMSGKWVGHPAQLFAVALARTATLPPELLEAAVVQLGGYRDGLTHERGVSVVDGQMADRATARHARELLRRATAFGLFDPRRALALGVVSSQELAE